MPLNECGLQAADANRAVLRYLAEANDCWGVTPDDGVSREMRITSSALTAEKETTVSNELRADRMVSDIVEVAATSGGEINIEFSAGSLDDFMQAFLLGLWTRPMTFDKFSGAVVSWVSASVLRVSGGDYTGYFVENRRIKTEGFINPKNNGYFEIDDNVPPAFSGGNTNITVTVASAVPEAGSATTKVLDANDVIVLNSSAIRAGTGPANQFDSNGTDAFTTAVAAGQLIVGQKVYVSGLGYEEGAVTIGVKETSTLTFTANQPVDEDLITINDGVTTVIFEFDTPDGIGNGGDVAVNIGGNVDATAAALVVAINASALAITASYDAPSNVLTLTNDLYTGGVLTTADWATPADEPAVSAWSGGLLPADEDTVTLFDGDKTVVFEFDSDNAFTRGRVGITIGATPAETTRNLAEAVMLALWSRKVQASAIPAVEVGTVVVATPDDGDTLTIDCGPGAAVTFEFESGGGVGGGNTAVTIGGSTAITAGNLARALNASALDLTARVTGSTVTIWNHQSGGAITKSDVDNDLTVTDFVSLNKVFIRNLRGEQGGSISDSGTGVGTTAFAGAQATAHGVYTLTAVTNDVLSVAEPVAVNANAGGALVTLKGSHLRNPGDLEDITPQSFTIETGFSDVGQYFVQTGMRVGTFGLSLSSGEIVEGSIEFMGKETTPRSSTLLGDDNEYTVLDSTATSVMNSTTNVGNVYKNGAVLATAVQSLEINGEATLRNQTAVSSKFPAGVAAGRFNLTGTITSYFETLEMYEHFINHETISLGFDFSDNDRNYYFFSIPAVIITSDPIAPGGIDQDVVEEMEWAAKRDPVLRTMFMIDRFSSLLPATV